MGPRKIIRGLCHSYFKAECVGGSPAECVGGSIPFLVLEGSEGFQGSGFPGRPGRRGEGFPAWWRAVFPVAPPGVTVQLTPLKSGVVSSRNLEEIQLPCWGRGWREAQCQPQLPVPHVDLVDAAMQCGLPAFLSLLLS